MAETSTEKATCSSCGSEVREGTTFCYNCGKPVAGVPDESAAEVHTSNGSQVHPGEKQAALDDLAERFKIDEVSGADKRAQAAAERKRARVRSRRNEVVWEPVDASGGRLFILVTLLIAFLTLLVVLAAVYWK